VILSDVQLRMMLTSGHIGIDPAPEDRHIQPASIDVHIGEDVHLDPWEFKLSHTLQTIIVPANLACQLTGKSSLGRLGLIIHTTAGWIDPGFEGQITLELVNLSREVIKLAEGDPIGQLIYQFLDQPAERPYGHPDLGSHYQHQMGTTASYLTDPWP